MVRRLEALLIEEVLEELVQWRAVGQGWHTSVGGELRPGPLLDDRDIDHCRAHASDHVGEAAGTRAGDGYGGLAGLRGGLHVAESDSLYCWSGRITRGLPEDYALVMRTTVRPRTFPARIALAVAGTSSRPISVTMLSSRFRSRSRTRRLQASLRRAMGVMTESIP